jgi:predicted enzyme related to lactoylglutathione lyase
MAMSEGGFVWYELMTSDVAGAQAFYAEVVGWGLTESGVPGMACTPPSTQGAVGWHELRPGDWEGAWAFYEGLFGWEKSYRHDRGAMGVYQTFSVGGTWTGGLMNTSTVPEWLYYITVAYIDAAASRIGEAGGTVLSGPHPVPGGSWVVMATDPQGGRFALTGARQSEAAEQRWQAPPRGR